MTEVDDPTQNEKQEAAPRPWVRYWARMFDIYIFSMLVGILLGLVSPSILESSNDVVLGVVLIFTWVFVESVLLCVNGTTPGKSLLKVTVTKNDGRPLTINDALTRSFRVWWRGMAVGIPLIALFTLIRGYRSLEANGETSWDRDSGFTVTHETIGIWRTLVVIVFFGLFLAAMVVGSMEGV